MQLEVTTEVTTEVTMGAVCWNGIIGFHDRMTESFEAATARNDLFYGWEIEKAENHAIAVDMKMPYMAPLDKLMQARTHGRAWERYMTDKDSADSSWTDWLLVEAAKHATAAGIKMLVLNDVGQGN